ncbi:N-acetyldiaminopimelate deacetylase [Lysinibacillus sp. SGAir0095]|uniref:N-acetyldiaminopimelate deacetylase n=1 Tax=Lysinibacillus sp. SGAir0095 TaxID=2070463 RepID=UPI0010CD293B|nr:N-acetyldiaminopimelate deacetylase [Lysinibacillus sp. SGAir0095]QCR31636.1 N-acetyldiaminopimelate deacetylase [Lysinibacillus sp. SGAir0095]
MDTLIQIRRELHQIPELGFQEFKTQAYLLDKISQFPQEHLNVITWKTGIVVKIDGSNPSKTIGWRSDIDGLPIVEETGLTFSSTHEGKMHACGHDCHMTIALGLVEALAVSPPTQNVVVYFQPAEEGPGGAEPMLNWLKAERPDLLADEIYALHIAPEYPVGTVATRPGLLFANTSELFIDLKGLGGHAAYPHKTRDMTVAAANLIVQLQTIVSRNVNPMDSAVVTIGKLTSGTVQNIIAENARLEGTIRTLNAEAMAEVKKRIEAICAGIEASFECEIHIDYGSMYYEVNNDSECAKKLLDFAEEFEGATSYECPAAMTGEDFGYFIKDIPGAMFWSGANCEYGLHHAKINPDEKLLSFNANFVEQFIRN